MSESKPTGGAGWVMRLLVIALVIALVNLYGATIQNYNKMEWKLRDLQRRIAVLEQRP